MLVLAGALLLEVAYVLLFSPFVTDDGPLHVGSAAALLDSIGGSDPWGRFVEWNPIPAPAIVANLLLVGLLPIVGMEWAERLLVIGYVCGVPLATLYAVRAMRPGWTWLAFFALPLTFSYAFLTGFFNFSYSIIAFLLTAGFVLRVPDRPTNGKTAALVALLLLTFFCHLVGYAAAALFVILVFGMRAVFRPELRTTLVRHGVVALLPSVVLALVYVATSNSAEPTGFTAPWRKVAGALTLEWGIVTFDSLEVVFCLAAASALGSLVLVAAFRKRPWRERNPNLLAVGVFTILVLLVAAVSPDTVGSGGAFITQRLVLFPAFSVLLWLAGQRLTRSHVLAASWIAIAAAAGLALVRYDDFRRLERIAVDLEPLIPCVEHGSTIVQANLTRVAFGTAARSDPLANESGKVAAATDGLDLVSADLAVDQWIQRYSRDKSPERHLVDQGKVLHDRPPPLNFDRFERATGENVDYVIVFGRRELAGEMLDSGVLRRFDTSLRDRYRLVARSEERWWELWAVSGPGARGTTDSRCPGSEEAA